MPLGGALTIGLISGGLSAGGSIAGGKNSANAQEQAAQLQATAQNNATNLNASIFSKEQQNIAPYVQAGQGAVNSLQGMLAPSGAPTGTSAGPSGPNGTWAPSDITASSATQQWTTPFNFNGVNLLNSPEYTFDLNQGLQAVQRSAAANGGLVSGGAMKDISNYAQGNALNSFQQAYGNALTNYQTAYNTFLGNQTNPFNKLAGVAQMGLGGTGQINQAGSTLGTNNTNAFLSGAANQGSYIAGAGNAGSAGIVGATNSFGNSFNTLANMYAQQNLQNSSFMTPTQAAENAPNIVNTMTAAAGGNG